MGESLHHIGDDGTPYFHAGVTPWRDVALGITYPHLADAQAADERYLVIHAQGFAMEPAYPPERAIETRRIEAPHVDAAFAQVLPEAGRGLGQRAHPVIQHAHAYSRFGFGDEGFGKSPADAVATEDIVFEMNGLL